MIKDLGDAPANMSSSLKINEDLHRYEVLLIPFIHASFDWECRIKKYDDLKRDFEFVDLFLMTLEKYSKSQKLNES